MNSPLPLSVRGGAKQEKSMSWVENAEWRPLEIGETHGMQLITHSWGDRLKLAYFLLRLSWGMLRRGEASMKVERPDPHQPTEASQAA
jgi:hypothetical protein